MWVGIQRCDGLFHGRSSWLPNKRAVYWHAVEEGLLQLFSQFFFFFFLRLMQAHYRSALQATAATKVLWRSISFTEARPFSITNFKTFLHRQSISWQMSARCNYRWHSLSFFSLSFARSTAIFKSKKLHFSGYPHTSGTIKWQYITCAPWEVMYSFYGSIYFDYNSPDEW